MDNKQLLEVMKNVKEAEGIPGGFQCIGNIEDVYPNLPEEALACYRTWIFEHENGLRVAMSDLGNSHMAYICEGSFDQLKKQLPATA